MAFVAFLDANVLYPAVLRDVLLTLAEAGVYQIRWSPDVLDEVEQSLARRVGTGDASLTAERARYAREKMEEAFPDAMVDRAAYADLIPVMNNAPEDHHVLAAAVVARADVLVTRNARHFPPEVCSPYGVEVQHPDEFLMHQFGLIRTRMINVLRDLASERRPPMNTVSGIIRALGPVTPFFCAMALAELALDD